jgi:5-methylcytosine-specific restriction endonuclease McrA
MREGLFEKRGSEMATGSTKNAGKKKLLKRRLFGSRSHARCCFCKRPMSFDQCTLEHVNPIDQQMPGSWNISNLRLSCKACNEERQTQDFAAFSEKVRMRCKLIA